VVPVTGQSWSADPFTLVERDSRLYGRGACDMKGYLACVLAMVPELTARMTSWLGGEYHAVLFEESGQAFGYALYCREPEYVYLRQFYVVPEQRQRGVGRAAIAWLRENAWRGERVRLEVLVGNAVGIAFWRALGFKDYCLTLEMESLSR